MKMHAVDKEYIRRRICDLGADVCGFAAVDRFSDAPADFAPTALFDRCQTVICFGTALSKGLDTISSRLLYGHYNEFCCSVTDGIALKASSWLENTYHCLCVPLPSDAPYEAWDTERMYGHGLLSMKHAAVNAGIGTLGKSTLLLNKDFGNRLTLGAVLTDLVIPSDRLSEPICPPACRRCVDSCPTGAISDGCVDQKLCRCHAYGKTARGYDAVNCNTCRTVCSMRFGKPVEKG